MTSEEKIKNIVAFLLIIFGEDFDFEEFLFTKASPEYLIEKYQRYVLSPQVEYLWGMHPTLKRVFDRWCEKYGLKFDFDEEGK